MGKISHQYLKVDPYKIIEEGFHKEEYQVSETLFSLCNEYMGIRSSFEEDIDLPSLRGSYFNGIYDYSKEEVQTGYKGIVKRTHFMLNSIDYFKMNIVLDDEPLNLLSNSFSSFYRELDLLNGKYKRQFIIHTKNGKNVTLVFERFLSLTECHNAFQKVYLKSDQNIKVRLEFILDNFLKQWGQDSYFINLRNEMDIDHIYSLNETTFTKQKVLSLMSIDSSNIKPIKMNKDDKKISIRYEFNLNKDEEISFIRYVTNLTSNEFDIDDDNLLLKAKEENNHIKELGFAYFLAENEKFYKNVFKTQDINIVGNDLDLQGIRYCIFMLNSTYHGYSPKNNIGAKGLSGEAYSGHAFWDSETYCLPYYLFNNLEAAKNLLLFRYNTLKEAKNRAKDLDCLGACYPIATLNGKEGCTLWQHASLQFQPSTGVVYGIFHYFNISHDEDFMYRYGYEMILEVSKFLLSRGQYNNDHSHFSFYAVMGPDEFKMMVNHNMYTNVMGKFTFNYLLYLKNNLDNNIISTIEKKCQVDENFYLLIKEASEKMLILKKDDLYEQNEGFFSLPHIDIDSINRNEFPLYSHWSYDRIYRGDMIKQPDVLMFMFLFLSFYDKKTLETNYSYYEPLCIHESSLSPSIHSIIANEISKEDDAIKFFGFASRLDLDNYNNNTNEGLHLTSIAAAWMNIIYGYGGLRSDDKIIKLSPKIPARWKSYSFHLTISGSLIRFEIDKSKVKITNFSKPITLQIYDEVILLNNSYETELK